MDSIEMTYSVAPPYPSPLPIWARPIAMNEALQTWLDSLDIRVNWFNRITYNKELCRVHKVLHLCLIHPRKIGHNSEICSKFKELYSICFGQTAMNKLDNENSDLLIEVLVKKMQEYIASALKDLVSEDCCGGIENTKNKNGKRSIYPKNH